MDSPPVGRELPAQLSFSTWRVNDYDLQIQHNEAVALACDYLGVTRTRADSYFDGSYRLPAPRAGASVAVRVIDMLGEEAVVVKPV